MHLGNIALNNLRRRKSKMIFLVFGMVFGIATIDTLFSISTAMKQDFDKKFNELGSKLIIAPNTKKLSLSYGGITVAGTGVSYDVQELQSGALDKIKNIPAAQNITIIAPKLLGVTEIAGSRVVIVGVEFQEEFAMKGYWEIDGTKPAAKDEILAGSKVAQKFNLKEGQDLTIKGQTFKLAGILHETGSEEDGLIFIDLQQTQSILGKEGTLSFVEISTATEELPIEQVKAEIQKVLPESKINTVTDVMESRKELVDRFSAFSLGVSLVVLLIGSLIVMTTMMASVNERTREIGIFRAIGFRKSHIMKIVYLEVAMVSILSGIIGFILGTGSAVVAAPRIVEQLNVAISWDPLLALGAVLLAMATGLAASTYPALQASKLDPAEALRFI